MASVKDDMRSGVVYETTRAIFKSLEEAAAGLVKTGGEHLGKKIQSFFDPKPRALFDFLVDNLYPLKDGDGNLRKGSDNKEITLEQTNKARDGIKKYLREAKRKNIENVVVSALIKVLTLDPTDEHGNFPKGHENAKLRLYQFGIMKRNDFWQSIETMVDDPGQEKIRRVWDKTKVKVCPKVVKAKNKIIDTGKKAGEGTAKGIKGLITEIQKRRDEIDQENTVDNMSPMSPWIQKLVEKSEKFKEGGLKC